MTCRDTHTVVAGSDIGLLGPLQVEILPDGRRARLLQPFRVNVEGRGIEAPGGFETDFASVPRVFWRIVPPWGRYSPAAVIHDYLYFTGHVPRAEADAVFLTLMERLGVPAWKRSVMYRAVRMFGKPAWDKRRGQDKATASR